MESDFSVSFINVGSADCTLIKCGDKSVLIDGGTNLVTDKITAYLRRSSVTHLDAVIVSHPDSDHCRFSHKSKKLFTLNEKN